MVTPNLLFPRETGMSVFCLPDPARNKETKRKNEVEIESGNVVKERNGKHKSLMRVARDAMVWSWWEGEGGTNSLKRGGGGGKRRS